MKEVTLRNKIASIMRPMVAKRLRTICDEKQISQTRLAVASGNSPALISYILNGKQGTNVGTLCTFAMVLGVEISDLVPSCAEVLETAGLTAEKTEMFFLKEKSDARELTAE